MREIKFRAWDKELKEMLEWDDYAGEIIDFIIQGRHIGEVVVMQYTGLEDKNGKEIYEGDIMKHYTSSHGFPIVFRYGSFWLDAPTLTLVSNMNVLGTVIGNIYENPELLK